MNHTQHGRGNMVGKQKMSIKMNESYSTWKKKRGRETENVQQILSIS